MASWHTEQLKYATGIGFLLSFYGALGMLVYFLPSEYGYGWKYKLIIIAVVLLTLPFALVIAYVANRRKKKREQAEQKDQEAKVDDKTGAAPQKLSTASANEEISQAAEETVQFLKSSNVGGGKEAVYALPWYIVAGTPKSGKSSLSLASGLNFQNLPSQRQSEQKFIRPTKNIDWRVTSDAVFLDTAGRYQTEGLDQEEWSSLLETVKKYRPIRPIDGMILTVNAERVLQADEKEIEEQAKVLRARIDEAMQRTKVRFPIYLVFTHADAIEGFRDSFSTSRKEDKNLVWGATIPLEKSQNAHTLFDPEYDLLHNSVMKRRIMRLSAPFPPIRQIKIFNFPLHFGSARKRLGNFISTLFRPNPFSENPFFRGFYFTAVPVNRPQMRGGGNQTMTNVAQTVGQSYFTEKLFRDVILRDKDLVATFQAQQVSAPILGWLATIVGAILTVALLSAAGYSLYKNKQVVDKASLNADTLLSMYKGDKNRPVLAKSPDETQIEIEKIENLRRSIEEFDDYDRRSGIPLSMRFGLYSGDRIFHEKLLPIYFNAIEQRFKKPVMAAIEEDLQKFTAKPTQDEEVLGKNYDLLQAYLMLSKKDPVYITNIESGHIIKTLLPYWEKVSKTPPVSKTLAEEQLKFFASQIDRPEYLGFEPNTPLVAAAQKNLKPFSAVVRTYKRMVTDVSRKVKPFTVTSFLGGRSAGVIEGTATIQGAFTIEGYRSFMKEAMDKAKDELAKPDWVLGETQADKVQSDGQDVRQLQDRYYNEYADNWQKLVRDTTVTAFTDKTVAADVMKKMSLNESPMAILIREIARQTNLSATPESAGMWEYLKSFIWAKEETKIGGSTAVEIQFAPLFDLIKEDEKTKQSQLNQYSAQFKGLSSELDGKSNDEIKTMSQDFTKQSGTITATVKSASDGIGERLKAFESTDATPAAKELAALMRKPLNNLRTFFGATGVEQLAKTWTSQVFAAAQIAEKGYPFDNNGEAEMQKITSYLNPVDGTLTVFYKQNLEKYFNGTPGQQLTLKESSAGMFSDEFVKYLNNAFRLQNALFPDQKSKIPKFNYTFTLQKVDTNTLAVEGAIDGQPVTSTGPGSATLNFPATSGDSGVILNFTSTSGDSGSTPGKTTTSGNNPQNSPTPSVNPGSTPVNKFLQGDSTNILPLKSPGPWGLFKFFDGGKPTPDGAGGYTLTYTLSNKKTLTITVKANGGDLFNRTYFTTVHAPDKLK